MKVYSKAHHLMGGECWSDGGVFHAGEDGVTICGVRPRFSSETGWFVEEPKHFLAGGSVTAAAFEQTGADGVHEWKPCARCHKALVKRESPPCDRRTGSDTRPEKTKMSDSARELMERLPHVITPTGYSATKDSAQWAFEDGRINQVEHDTLMARLEQKRTEHCITPAW